MWPPRQADRTLCAVFLSMKAKGLGPEVFWSVYRDVSQWLLPVVAIDRLLAIRGSWDGCDADIDAATCGSELGLKMFAGAVKVAPTLCGDVSSRGSCAVCSPPFLLRPLVLLSGSLPPF